MRGGVTVLGDADVVGVNGDVAGGVGDFVAAAGATDRLLTRMPARAS